MTGDRTLTKDLGRDCNNPRRIGNMARLLLVDDEPKNLRLLEALLAPHGYDLLTATSGEECLDIVTANPPDIVLLDIMMPGMDGYEVTQRLRANESTRLLPIVIVSALSDVGDRVRGIEMGCDDFISKPFNKDEILAKIHTTLRLSYYRRQLDEKEKFDALVSRVSEGIAICTPDWKISQMNANGAKYLCGQIGDNLLDCIFAHYTASVTKTDLARASVSRESFLLARLAEAGNEPLYLHSTLDILTSPDAEVSSIVLTMRDMTKEQMEQRRRETFLNTVSYKLRLPLLEISQGLDELRDGSLGALSKEQARILGTIAEESHALSVLVGKLNRFSIVNSLSIINKKVLDLPKDKINLAAYLPTVVDSAIKESGSTNVEAHIEVEDKSTTVEVSTVYFDMMIQSLVENAIKFCDVDDVALHVTVTNRNPQVLITLTDNGPGIPPNEMGRVFEAFYQIEKNSTAAHSGAGLGLSLVKRLAEAYGGSVWLEPTPVGSSFTVALPAG